MRILITGATGFLGTHLVSALLTQGHEVVATVRPSSDTKRLEAAGVTIARASLSTGEGLGPALSGVEGVLHCAGGGQVKYASEFHTQNVVPTKTMLEATLKFAPNVRRFVLASSIAAGPARSDYGRAKRDSEALAIAASNELPTTCLRLPSLYGPFDTRWLPAFRAAKIGISPVVGSGAPMSLLYATDAASAMMAPLFTDHASGCVYDVDDGTPASQAEIGRAIADALGKRPFEVRVPPAVLFGAARLAEAAGKLTKRKVFLTRDKVRDMLADDWAIDSSQIRSELRWTSHVGLREGMRLTREWLASERLL